MAFNFTKVQLIIMHSKSDIIRELANIFTTLADVLRYSKNVRNFKILARKI